MKKISWALGAVVVLFSSQVSAQTLDQKFGKSAVDLCVRNQLIKDQSSESGFALKGLSDSVQCKRINQQMIEWGDQNVMIMFGVSPQLRQIGRLYFNAAVARGIEEPATSNIIGTGDVPVAKNDLCGVSENHPDFNPDFVEPPFEPDSANKVRLLEKLIKIRCK